MFEKDFDINEAIQFGWKLTKKNLSFFIPFMILIMIVSVTPDFLTKNGAETQSFSAFIINFVSWIFSMYLGMGAIKVSLLIAKSVRPKFSSLVTPFSVFSDYLIGIIIYTLIVMGGLLLFIVPGVILGIKYRYIPYLIIDEGMRPIDALHKSDEITLNIRMKLFLFSMLLIAINLAGFFLFFVGLLITIPITWIAEVYVYKKLISQAEIIDDVEIE